MIKKFQILSFNAGAPKARPHFNSKNENQSQNLTIMEVQAPCA